MKAAVQNKLVSETKVVESMGCSDAPTFEYQEETLPMCELCARQIRFTGLCAECNIFMERDDGSRIYCDDVFNEMVVMLEYNRPAGQRLEDLVNDLILQASRNQTINTDKLTKFLERLASQCALEIEHQQDKE